MPQGFVDLREAELDKAHLLDQSIRVQLRTWWLERKSARARTPNFDLASTCRIDGKPGLLLVEAKAHDEELHKESAGKRLKSRSSEDSKASHETIGRAIDSARAGLEKAILLHWEISRDSHYQMSNRFAWSWKLTELGIPVVLIYLGFLKAAEMSDKGKPFNDHADWEQLVRGHSTTLFPSQVWGKRWMPNGQSFIPFIRSVDQPLDHVAV